MTTKKKKCKHSYRRTTVWNELDNSKLYQVWVVERYYACQKCGKVKER